ncbi:MAG: CopD family protein, partial [Dehalococcoidia bacterium]
MNSVRSHWPLLGVVALALAFGLTLARPNVASAHAVLERSLPVQNQQLQEPPELVETWYSEPLERSLTTLKVLDTQRNEVQAGETLFSNEESTYAAVALPPDLGPGIYTVTYENVSTVDGHTWSGFFSFIVLEADGSVPAGEPPDIGGLAGQSGFLPDATDGALRWIGIVGAAVLAGGMFFALVVARPAAGFLAGERKQGVESEAVRVVAMIVAPAALAVIVSTVGQLLLFADRIGGLGEIGGILSDTRSGELWLSRMALSAALALLFIPALTSAGYRASRYATLTLVPGVIGSLGLLVTYSLGSHAADGGGQFWSITSDLVHFAATAAWLGALVQLPLAFWWSRRLLEGGQRALYLANVLDRFSWLSVISVALLIGSGVFNGFVQLPTFEALYETTYGRVLIAKLALIVPLLAIAGLNARVIKPALVAAVDVLHDEDTRRRPTGGERSRVEGRLDRLQRLLPRTALAELLLGVAVLASASVLAQTTTADGELRLDASTPSGEFVDAAPADDLDVELSITPFGIGLNTFTITLTPDQGQELGEVLGVRLSASFDNPDVLPSAGRQAVTQDLDPTDSQGIWSSEAALLTQPGAWNVQTRIRRRGLDDADTVITVPDVGGYLAREEGPPGLFDLPFTFVDWNIVAGGAMVTLGVGVFLIWHNRPRNWERGTTVSVGLSSAFAMIAGAVLLFGVHAHQGVQGSTSPIEPTEDSLALGESIFVRNCITCHGQTGEGDGPLVDQLPYPPPRLGDHVPFHNDRTLFLWVSEGLP